MKKNIIKLLLAITITLTAFAAISTKIEDEDVIEETQLTNECETETIEETEETAEQLKVESKTLKVYTTTETTEEVIEQLELLPAEISKKLAGWRIYADNKKLYEIINNTNSVCVTIRRGDYLSTNNKNVYYLCDEAYFQKAIQLIATKVNNPVFIFFSDDIEWVKNNIKVKFEAYYERGDDPIWEKIRLMYSCKHFIISNSSFSWWAQYLSRNEQKVVVSPNRWYRKGCVTTLIDEKFLTIEV